MRTVLYLVLRPSFRVIYSFTKKRTRLRIKIGIGIGVSIGINIEKLLQILLGKHLWWSLFLVVLLSFLGVFQKAI